MENITINKTNLQAAYDAAEGNVKDVLRMLFGDAVTAVKDNRPITERVQSYEGACRELGEEPTDFESLMLPSDVVAMMKLRTIVRALNEGWTPEFAEDEWRYYPWHYLYTQEELDDMGDSEKKERRMIDTGDYQTEYAGFGYAYSYPAPSGAIADIGSRLCLRSRELAEYCGKQFIKLWADFNLIRK